MRRRFNIFRRLERLETRTIFAPSTWEPDPERTKLIAQLVNDAYEEPWHYSEEELEAFEHVTGVPIDRDKITDPRMREKRGLPPLMEIASA